MRVKIEIEVVGESENILQAICEVITKFHEHKIAVRTLIATDEDTANFPREWLDKVKNELT